MRWLIRQERSLGSCRPRVGKDPGHQQGGQEGGSYRRSVGTQGTRLRPWSKNCTSSKPGKR